MFLSTKPTSWKSGENMLNSRTLPSELDRFLDKCKIEDGPLDSPCVLWQGCKDRAGYGQVTLRRKMFKAHRVAYMHWVGEIPDGAVICHKCDNPSCVNHDHLFAGTHADNSKDMVNKNRQQKGELINTSKLSNMQVAQIRRLISEGDYPLAEIARQFGVSPAAVQYHKRKIEGQAKWQR